MRIAICDDDSQCRGWVLDLTDSYAEERRDRVIVYDVFTEPAALLEAVTAGREYDIFLLDIVMPGMNGIALGQALRARGVEGKIIYLTSSKEYALDSYRVRAFDYLLKPVDKKAFFATMDEAVSCVRVKKDRMLAVKTKEGNRRVAFESILYGALSRRAAVYHLTDGSIVEGTTLRTTFTEAVAPLLEDSRFVLCGASMVVNLHHVTSVRNEGVVFADPEPVFLGRKACRELRSAWNQYWTNEEV